LMVAARDAGLEEHIAMADMSPLLLHY